MRNTILLKKPMIIVLWLSILLSFTTKDTSSLISGTISDEKNKPLSNVEILNSSNNFISYSNEQGNFSIKGKINDELNFMYSGKIAKTVKISKLTKNEIKFDTLVIHTYDDKTVNPFKNTIIGRVTENGSPLPGVIVKIKGINKGTTTDINGYYGIDAKNGNVLIFSYLGYITQEVKVLNKTLDVNLISDSKVIESVVITGALGVKRNKSAVTSSYKTVPATEISTPKPEGVKALVGKVSGLSITSSEEVKKDKIVLRGMATLSADKTIVKESIISSQKAGQLTAGEVNDFSNWDYWQGLTKVELLQWKNHWKFAPTYRYSVVLTNHDGFAIQNEKVHLLDDKKDIIWTAVTDNTGRAELWYHPNDSTVVVAENVSISDSNNKVIITKAKEFHKGINTYQYIKSCNPKNKVNIAFMIDATGSMQDEISYLQAELQDVITKTKTSLPEVDLKMGSVFYRDQGDDYVVKNFDFTSETSDLMQFIQKQNANQGGDFPEAVIEGLESSIHQLSWEEDATTKLLFVLLDAPPHYDDEKVKKLQELTKLAAEKGIRIITIAASGIDKSTEYLMRAIALETNGTYLFITNHSGIGNDHIEPTTKKYKVEMLNDLMLRVILQFSETKHCVSNDNYPKNTKIEDEIINSEKIKWSFYPNPTNGLVTIDLDRKANEIYVFDTTGKIIFYKNDSSKQYNFDLSGLPNAIYYLKVVTSTTSLFGKVIKTM
jgi:hypothetical protein